MAIWYILWPFGNIVVIFHHFGILCQEKSGNPGIEDGGVIAKVEKCAWLIRPLHMSTVWPYFLEIDFSESCNQGDQIGRIWASWAIV
jgi:hypothetical protein